MGFLDCEYGGLIRIFTPALPEYLAVSLTDYCSGAHGQVGHGPCVRFGRAVTSRTRNTRYQAARYFFVDLDINDRPRRGFRHPMDGMRWQYLKSVRQLLVGNEDLAFRDAFEKCTRPCMNRHPIFLSETSA